MAAADWNWVERETVEKIRLLKAVVDGLPSGPLSNKICNDLVMPAMVRLGVFNQCVTVQVDQLKGKGIPCEMCDAQGKRQYRGMGDWETWTCPRCKGTGFHLPTDSPLKWEDIIPESGEGNGPSKPIKYEWIYTTACKRCGTECVHPVPTLETDDEAGLSYAAFEFTVQNIPEPIWRKCRKCCAITRNIVVYYDEDNISKSPTNEE